MANLDSAAKGRDINLLTEVPIVKAMVFPVVIYGCETLTIQVFVAKVMSLLFNMLSRFVIAFLPRSKHLLMSWLQSPFAVIL